mmetsp:Transcript_40286/g.38753  ORF Transcript_40286/g.38753 Transcript_40286/m.38753 type:complete len:98 (+) Transcript_40286:706-999(+)
MFVYGGKARLDNSVFDVEEGANFFYSNGIITANPDPLSPTTLTVDGDQCTCSGVLREVEYVVNVTLSSTSDSYDLASIIANTVVDSNPITATCGNIA